MARRAAWDIPPADLDAGANPPGGIDAGEQLVGRLLRLYCRGQLSAVQVCILCYWAMRAGVDAARRFALAPGKCSGHYQRKLDIALKAEVSESVLYKVETPMVDHKSHGSREKTLVQTKPLHESLVDEIQTGGDSLLGQWREILAEGAWPAYNTHPVVRQSSPDERDRILPISLYMDATQFQNRDSVLVLTVGFTFSTRRHLCFTVRKSKTCNCSCGGWCTYYPLFHYVSWCLHALAAGTWPRGRHDGSDWRPEDQFRASNADKALGFRAVVVDIMGDWSEFALRWALPNWSSALAPCPFCTISLSDMQDGSTDFVDRDAAAYEESCRECERWVVLPNAELHRRIRFSMYYSEDRKGHMSGNPFFGSRCFRRAVHF